MFDQQGNNYPGQYPQNYQQNPAMGAAAQPFTAPASPRGDIILNPEAAPKPKKKWPIIAGVAAAVLVVAAIVTVIVVQNNQSQTQTTAPVADENFNKLFSYLYTGEEKTETITDPSAETSDYKWTEYLTDASLTGTVRNEYFNKAKELWQATETQGLEAADEDFIFLYTYATSDFIDSSDLLTDFLSGMGVDPLKNKIQTLYQALVDLGGNSAAYAEAMIEYLNETVDELVVLQNTDCLGYIINGLITDCPNSAAATAQLEPLKNGLFADNTLIKSIDELFAYPDTINTQLISTVLSVNSAINDGAED